MIAIGSLTFFVIVGILFCSTASSDLLSGEVPVVVLFYTLSVRNTSASFCIFEEPHAAIIYALLQAVTVCDLCELSVLVAYRVADLVPAAVSLVEAGSALVPTLVAVAVVKFVLIADRDADLVCTVILVRLGAARVNTFFLGSAL